MQAMANVKQASAATQDEYRDVNGHVVWVPLAAAVGAVRAGAANPEVTLEMQEGFLRRQGRATAEVVLIALQGTRINNTTQEAVQMLSKEKEAFADDEVLEWPGMEEAILASQHHTGRAGSHAGPIISTGASSSKEGPSRSPAAPIQQEQEKPGPTAPQGEVKKPPPVLDTKGGNEVVADKDVQKEPNARQGQADQPVKAGTASGHAKVAGPTQALQPPPPKATNKMGTAGPQVEYPPPPPRRPVPQVPMDNPTAGPSNAPKMEAGPTSAGASHKQEQQPEQAQQATAAAAAVTEVQYPNTVQEDAEGNWLCVCNHRVLARHAACVACGRGKSGLPANPAFVPWRCSKDGHVNECDAEWCCRPTGGFDEKGKQLRCWAPRSEALPTGVDFEGFDWVCPHCAWKENRLYKNFARRKNCRVCDFDKEYAEAKGEEIKLACSFPAGTKFM